MANTAGFEIVAELTKGVLQQKLEAAWDQSIIPHSYNISPGIMFGPYQVTSGNVNIDKDGLTLDLVPADNGTQITIQTRIVQVEIGNSPIPSTKLFNMNAKVFITIPVGTLPDKPGEIQVGILLKGLPRDKVKAILTSGNPIEPITLSMIQEYVHQKFIDGTIPQTSIQKNVNWGMFTTDIFSEIKDNSNDPTHQIIISQPTLYRVKLLIPIYLSFRNTKSSFGPSPLPMDIEAKISIIAPMDNPPGFIKADLTQSTVDVESLTGANTEYGKNYDTNKSAAKLLGINLDDLLKTEIIKQGKIIIGNIGDINISVPTISQIQSFIEDQVHGALINRGNIPFWTPQAAGNEVTINDVAIKVLDNALAIGINNLGSADPNIITNFIPVDRSCAIAICASKILQIIDATIHRPESEGGFGPDFPPKTFSNIDGHDARLNSLTISLIEGAINIKGDVTVVDAIGCIDVDASFEANVNLIWEDNPDGTQTIKAVLIGEPDIDMSWLAWLFSFLIGFITLGLVGGIIGLVVMRSVEGIAECIGGKIVSDDVNKQFKVVSAWPQKLEGIGDVITRFENPIDIDPDGIIFPDEYVVIATYANVINAMAKANGPYIVDGGSPLQFNGGPLTPNTNYEWDFGDGNTAKGAIVSHTYADNGAYIAKLTTNVTQPGGSHTREFALVRVRNVPPLVKVGPDMIVNEGQIVEYIATFTDPEWVDTHKAIFDFGDNSLPVGAIISETNNPPHAEGTARAKHAYCTEGKYTVTVEVIDDDGGIGRGTFLTTVRNVAPTVDAGMEMFAYNCTPITLIAHFKDPGWCDKHKGFWTFGDCTPSHTAIIREINKPPEGTGIAIATHIYYRCGTYLAECTVIDDNGGIGYDTVVIRVIDVLNRDFESGFNNRPEGAVANEWESYVTKERTDSVPIFSAEEFIIHSGQRSQKISASGMFKAGIYQQIGANIDWDYQISVWYHQYGDGKCRLGIDPLGGTDPTLSSIVWTEGFENHNWAQLAERVTAKSHKITIFLEVLSDAHGCAAYFDDVTLIASPCILKDKEHLSKREEKCVNWKEEKEPSEVGMEYKKNEFTFESKKSLRIVTWGTPSNIGKMLIPSLGLWIRLPLTADRVLIHIWCVSQIEIKVFNQAGEEISQVTMLPKDEMIQTLELRKTDISMLCLTGGGSESLLIDLCVFRGAEFINEYLKKDKD